MSTTITRIQPDSLNSSESKLQNLLVMRNKKLIFLFVICYLISCVIDCCLVNNYSKSISSRLENSIIIMNIILVCASVSQCFVFTESYKLLIISLYSLITTYFIIVSSLSIRIYYKSKCNGNCLKITTLFAIGIVLLILSILQLFLDIFWTLHRVRKLSQTRIARMSLLASELGMGIGRTRSGEKEDVFGPREVLVTQSFFGGEGNTGESDIYDGAD